MYGREGRPRNFILALVRRPIHALINGSGRKELSFFVDSIRQAVHFMRRTGHGSRQKHQPCL